MPGEYEPLISTCRLRGPRFGPYLWLGLACALAGTALRADLVLTNYTASRPLKVMASGDSITGDNAVVGDAMSTYSPATVPIAGLPAGTNVVAVEVHRFSPSQASLSHDLELFGAGAFAPQLAASREGYVGAVICAS
jgi:hypothetical protein